MGELIDRNKERTALTPENIPLQEHVVLNTSHNLSFAGSVEGGLRLYEEDGLLVKLDKKTNFTIWCPLTHINRLLVVPIAPENEPGQECAA